MRFIIFNIMKRIFPVIIFLFCHSLVATAITQQGLVRSISRPEHSGETLSGAIIRVRGSHNAVESQTDGSFSLLLQNRQNGDALVFSSVILSGFEPAEKEFLGRQFACSDKVPMEIILVNTAQLQREKEAIAAKARENIEIYYEQQLARLDKALAEGALRNEEYQKQLDALEQKYERFEPLLQAMSDQYARTDISRLDSLSQAINAAIEAGNPDEAERLIKQKGDLDERERLLRQEEQQLRQAQAMLDQAAANTRARRQELGDDYYRLYSIAITRLAFDSAAYYLCRRAELDTTNVDWQLQAGKFVRDVTNDRDKAAEYLTRAMRQAEVQYTHYSGQTATAYNEVGVICRLKGDFTKAKELYEQSLQIREKIKGKETPEVAESLNNIAELMRAEKDYAGALKLHQRALKIRTAAFTQQSKEVAESKNNIGGIYYSQGKYKQALPYFEQAATTLEQVGAAPRRLATAINNLGGTYYQLGDRQKAAQCFDKAYELYKTALGENHPLTRNAKANKDYILGER